MTRQPAACVIFLGCPKNHVDSEQVLGSLVQAGYRLSIDPAAADVVVVTTCAFLQASVRESEAKIKEMLRLKQHNPRLRVVVAGCLVERYGPELRSRLPGIDGWARLEEMPRIARVLGPGGRRIFPGVKRRAAGVSRVLSTPRHYAYLKIADGCDNRCSYCTIPDIRGANRSRPMEQVLGEAGELAGAGVKELILVAQDTTAYGLDSAGRPELDRLLSRLARIDGIRWLRLMYAHPAHLTESVIDQLGSNSKLCRYLDLPLQHVSDRLLAKMNRPYSSADIELLLENLRAIPDLHLRTTFIVGFPGETQQEFAELLRFVKEARFDRMSAYTFSPEPGTPARRYGVKVPEPIRRSRLARLMQAQAAVSRARLRRLVGRELSVLVDSPGLGRTQWDAPDVDGVVRLYGRPVRPGRFVTALVTGSSTHELTACPV